MIRSLLLSLSILAVAQAAELAIRDFRLGVASRPGDFDFAIASSTANPSGSDAFDAGASLEVGGRWSFARTGDSLGLVLGADLALDGQSYGSGGSSGLTTTYGKLAAGLGWAVNDRLTLLGEGLVGYGLSALKLPATTVAPELSASGTAISYEARLTATWQVSRDFNAGLMAGWLVTAHDLKDGDMTLTLDQSGWYAGLVFGWRITDLPSSLE